MIDFDDVFFYIKMYYRVAIGIAVLIALYIGIWLFKGYGGNPEIKETITEIKQTAEINEKRADAIIETEKAKEVLANEEIKKSVDAVSDDDLPDLLAGLLRDYRNGR